MLRQIFDSRAIYKEADIYLLDDPLSAVDANVGYHLFSQCITGFLEKKAVILVTHQLQYLASADEILLLNNVNYFFLINIFLIVIEQN